MANAEIGSVAPDFVGRGYDGEDTLISHYKGQVIVLTFWDGLNDNSFKMLYGLKSIDNYVKTRLGNNKLKVIASSYNGSYRNFRKETKKMIKSLDLHYTDDRNQLISGKYFNINQGRPVTFVIDEKGNVKIRLQ